MQSNKQLFKITPESTYEQHAIEEIESILERKNLSHYATKINIISEDIARYQSRIDNIKASTNPEDSLIKRISEKLSRAIKQRDEIIQLAIQGAHHSGSLRDEYHEMLNNSSSQSIKEYYNEPESEPSTEFITFESSFIDDSSDDNFIQRQKEIDQSKYEKTESIQCNGSSFVVPSSIWNHQLFPYQQNGVIWLWNLYQNNTGGILGDEMGLGKTVQVIAFWSSLCLTNPHLIHSKPMLVICPATILQQWIILCHTWWPFFRVIVFHHSNKDFPPNDHWFRSIRSSKKGVDIILTTYSTFQQYQSLFTSVEWLYVVLDEGHKIRNPQADITLACKAIPTHNRLIVTATPIQNNLVELWSLMDFACPGRLGTLLTFTSEFSKPIQIGGYDNADSLQTQAAYKCAVALKELIEPYLLRRWKREISLQLPNKTEQIVQCKLTEIQYQIYKDIISRHSDMNDSDDNNDLLYVLDILRKLCNHPMLLSHTNHNDTYDIDSLDIIKDSCKMQIVIEILDNLDHNSDKVLIFCQTKQMLDIFERVITSKKYSYMRMDGDTDIGKRHLLVQKFNAKDDKTFIFLLTTRVGGIGVNLTGANYVILYDPDWNPSTDIQARERAWRIGQKRTVTIFRLMTLGTIEQKIYYRQLFKQILTNRILQNPERLYKQFKPSDLHDLLTLDDYEYLDDQVNDELNNSESTGLLGMLLDIAKVRSVSREDANMIKLDMQKLNQEADKIVARSIELLKQSSQNNISSNSKTDLLKQLWAKTAESEPSLLNNEDAHPLFLELISFFKENKDYTRTTEEVMEYFRGRLDLSELPFFKKCLKSITTRKVKNIWCLKQSFHRE